MTVQNGAEGPGLAMSLSAILLSDSGLLVHDELRVKLVGTDAALVRFLLDRFPRAISGPELTNALWPNETPTDLARRTRLMRVRRQLAAVDLALRNRAGVGFTLERSMTSVIPTSNERA